MPATQKRPMILHCLVTPDRRLGVMCKRRGQHTAVIVKSAFLAKAAADDKDALCKQCCAALNIAA